MTAEIKKLYSKKEIWKTILRNYPINKDIYLVRADGRYSILPLKWTNVESSHLFSMPLKSCPFPSPNLLPYATGYMGVLSYDLFGNNLTKKTSPILIRAYQTLVFDHFTEQLYLATEPDIESKLIEHDVLSWTSIESLLSSRKIIDKKTEKINLTPEKLDDFYLKAVSQIIEDIKNGRYYQLNYLRYFKIKELDSLQPLLEHFVKLLEPYSLWIRNGSKELMSFSPERFIKLVPKEKNLVEIISEPIKGTRGKSSDKNMDHQIKIELLESKKDLAELHMIVDLIRNDLNKVCKNHSVNVIQKHVLKSFQKVHHLISSISGKLKNELTYGELFQKILPCGSITGTPKKEVMEAILQLEGRNRGYFMGVGFILDIHTGFFDSSVLIRTLWCEEGTVQYAAGSGIVLKSTPLEELKEVQQKCRIITDLSF